MISKISKEKQIFLESFDRRNLKRNNTKNIMDRMFQGKQRQIRKFREEEYDNKVREWKKQGTFDMSKLGFNQKERISPTSRSDVRSFRNLHEQRLYEDSIELGNILKELE